MKPDAMKPEAMKFHAMKSDAIPLTLVPHAGSPRSRGPRLRATVRGRIGAAAPALLAVSAALLGGCSIFDRPAPTASHFLLDVPAQPRAEGAALGSLVVRRATAISPYDSRGFVYRLANGEWRVDTYNGFLTEPTDMVSDAMMRGFEQCGRFALVTGPGFTSATDYAAETVMEAFYADFSDPARPMAVVQLRTYITDRSGGGAGVLQTLVVEARVPLPDGTPRGVSEGMSGAVGQAIAQLVAKLPAAAWPRGATRAPFADAAAPVAR